MSNADPHMQIARKIRSIEAAKIELVQQVAEILRSLQAGNERDLAKTLGELIALAYFIASQTGTPLEVVEREVLQGLPRTLGRDSSDAADFEYVLRYLASKR
ncbi:hypothetical protein LLE49_13245 [Alicyclobacillus tolerans]|uniref:MazG-like family protein n=1 Tax=Alicyclobacillus tolerans TaxID=90970 RepID=UPI001F2F4256|nr:MazG-like family protein [Alicyclobacillus tolerans]MCF8565684.1 hypothetical protein [Alicyclobacillus tolerans]